MFKGGILLTNVLIIILIVMNAAIFGYFGVMVALNYFSEEEAPQTALQEDGTYVIGPAAEDETGAVLEGEEAAPPAQGTEEAGERPEEAAEEVEGPPVPDIPFADQVAMLGYFDEVWGRVEQEISEEQPDLEPAAYMEKVNDEVFRIVSESYEITPEELAAVIDRADEISAKAEEMRLREDKEIQQAYEEKWTERIASLGDKADEMTNEELEEQFQDEIVEEISSELDYSLARVNTVLGFTETTE